MYDTLRFNLEGVDIAEGNLFSVIPPLLNDKHKEKNRFHKPCTVGYFHNFRVICDEFSDRITFTGSLGKYFFSNNNTQTLTRQTTQEAVERMSNELGFDIGMGKLTRIDFSTVLPMKHQPKDYYKCLLRLPHYGRTLIDTTLYFNAKSKKVVFYDKDREMVAKGVKTVDTLQNGNLLRYELRLIGKIAKQMGRKSVTMKTLYEKTFYNDMVQLWERKFNDIVKLKCISMETKATTTAMAKKELLAVLIQASGEAGKTIIGNYLEQFEDRAKEQETKRLLSDLKKMEQGEGTETDNELVKELKQAIKDRAKYKH